MRARHVAAVDEPTPRAASHRNSRGPFTGVSKRFEDGTVAFARIDRRVAAHQARYELCRCLPDRKERHE